MEVYPVISTAAFLVGNGLYGLSQITLHIPLKYLVNFLSPFRTERQ